MHTITEYEVQEDCVSRTKMESGWSKPCTGM